MDSLLAGYTLVVIVCGVEMAMENFPGRKSSELQLFHPDRAGPCFSTSSVFRSGFYCLRLRLNSQRVVSTSRREPSIIFRCATSVSSFATLMLHRVVPW